MAISDIPQDVRAAIKSVAEKAPPPPEDLLYPWLQSVYILGVRIEKKGAKEALRIAQAIRNRHKLKTGSELFRVLIEVTAKPHVHLKMRSKYANVLRWCRQRGVSPMALHPFIKRHGNLNGCIEEAKKYRRRATARRKRT